MSTNKTSRKPRVTSYFEDDDVDEPRAAISRTASSAVRPNRGAALGMGGETLFKHKHSAEYDKDIYKYEAQHKPHAHHHAHEEARTHAKPKTSKKQALRETIKTLNQEMHAWLKKSDDLLNEYHGTHSEAIKSMLKHRDACIEIRDKADAKFLHEHESKVKENSKAFTEKVKLPHPSLHKDRVIYVHSKTYTFHGINKLATELQAIVDEYGGKEDQATCPQPRQVEGKDHAYHIIPVIKYLAREKYRVVEALLNHLRHTSSESHSAWQKSFVHNSHEITTIKEKIAGVKKTLIGLRTKKQQKKRELRPRERWILPDTDDLPKQEPAPRRHARG